MDAATQIALWSQRALHGKRLHLPVFRVDVVAGADGKIDSSASLDSLQQFPVCGRQLNNHRSARAQVQSRLEYATSLEEFTYQLLSGHACRHCAKTSGLLVTPVFAEEPNEGEEDE